MQTVTALLQPDSTGNTDLHMQQEGVLRPPPLPIIPRSSRPPLGACQWRLGWPVMREVCADRTPLTPPSRNGCSSPRWLAEASEEPGRNETAAHLSQNVLVGLTDGTKSSVPAKSACSQFHRNGPGTHSGPHQPLTHLDRKQERGKEGGTNRGLAFITRVVGVAS